MRDAAFGLIYRYGTDEGVARVEPVEFARYHLRDAVLARATGCCAKLSV